MAVPINNVKLSDVTQELYGDAAAGRSLVGSFASSVDGSFDPVYKENKDSLLDFRNYGAVDLRYQCYCCLELNDSNPSTNDIIDATGVHPGYLDYDHDNWQFQKAGKISYSMLNSEGGDNKVMLTNSDDISTTDYTISAWIKGYVGGFHFADISSFSSSEEGIYYYTNSVQLYPSLYFIYWNGSSYEYVSASAGVAQNNWTHFVAVKAGGRVKLYVGGDLETDVAASYSSVFGRMRMPNNTPGFFGYRDQWAFWNRGLNAAEVAELNNNGNGLAYSGW